MERGSAFRDLYRSPLYQTRFVLFQPNDPVLAAQLLVVICR